MATFVAEPSAKETTRPVLVRGKDKAYRVADPNGDLVVGPVTPQNDHLLGYAYLRFKEDGLLPVIYYEAESGGPTLRWFIDHHLQAGTTLGAFIVEPSGKHRLVGLGWINYQMQFARGKHKKADVGMGFFRGTSPSHSKLLTQMMIDWTFNEIGLDQAVGITPSPNRMAVRFLKGLGFELFGPIPNDVGWHGEMVSAYVSVMTRERWAGMEVFE
jgi:RimJ/RimL family protein N-acetyltransferase